MIVSSACFGVLLLLVLQRTVNAIPGESFEKGYWFHVVAPICNGYSTRFRCTIFAHAVSKFP